MSDSEQRARQRTPLPTRVSRACERCRRNKSRCDAYRPCSLCLRANAECLPGEVANRPARQNSSGEAFNQTSANNNKRKREEGPTEGPHRIPGMVSRPSIARSTSSDYHTSPQGPPEWQNEAALGDDGEAESTMSMARKIYSLDRQYIDEYAVSAIPGAEVSNKTPSVVSPGRFPIQSFLTNGFPPRHVAIDLLEEYFESVHWFSLVIYEPKFRQMFYSILDGHAEPFQKPFLILLSTVLGLGAWYRSQKPDTETGRPRSEWKRWSSELVKNAENELVEVMDQNSVPAIQTLILLGSFYVYHGRPNLSFSLLGASVKAAQALGLHREPSRTTFHDCEERKRVWWTIYTWDMFASVTYGRPLGINHEDCTVTMPLDFSECISFDDTEGPENRTTICFSTYQRELNRLYTIASPAIKKIYGTRLRKGARDAENNTYLQLAKEVTSRLWDWRRSLPQQLTLDMGQDCSPEMNATAKAYCLQSLALQLTFDNLLIILHRPFLAWHIDSLQRGGADIPTLQRTPSLSQDVQTSSPQEWWEAALRTSRVTELPQLAQLATDSHLVAFLAINLFNAAIVMVVMALSDPLSDKAQEVKRIITRVFRLQEVFGRRSKLSMQSSAILKNVIQLLLRRENEAIFAPVMQAPGAQEEGSLATTPSSTSGLLSVRDTLNLPIGLTPGPEFQHSEYSQGPGVVSGEPSFHQSLASVQKVFSSSSSDNHSMHHTPQHLTGHSQSSMLPDSTGVEGWSDMNATHQHTDLDGTMGGFNNATANNSGVYWFWDTVWDGGLG